MTLRQPLIALVCAVAALTALPGCAVSRGQSSVGEYIDDATITSRIKAHFIENKAVDAAAISVETLNGTVLLSGFAKDSREKSTAESIAAGTKGVKSVKNEITVRG